MSCYAYGATFLLVLLLWWIISRFSSETTGSTRLGGEPDSPTRVKPTVDIDDQGERQTVVVAVPLTPPIPEDLTVQVREHPTLPLDDQEKDERAYYALVETPSVNPETLFGWSTPARRAAVLTAWWRLREAFQLQGGQIRAQFAVARPDDPRIRNATWVLETLARDLSGITEEPAEASAAEPELAGQEPRPLPLAGEEEKTEAPRSTADSADGSEPIPTAAAASGPAPDDAAALPPGAVDEPGSVSELMSWLVADKTRPGSELAREVTERWKGKRVAGEGQVSVSNRVLGTDFDFGVSGGHRVTLKVAESGQSGLMGPTVVLHLPEAPPDQALSYGRTVRFSGVVREYRPLVRNLLLEQGRIE